MTFDPASDAPQDDAQAGVFLRHGRDGRLSDTLVRLYQVRRAKGDSVLDACNTVLLALVGETPDGGKDEEATE